MADGPVDYAAKQSFRRCGDTLIAELPRKGRRRKTSPACWRSATAAASNSTRCRGRCREGGTPLGELGANALLWAVLGAIAGGILLNLMPCVFPILGVEGAAPVARGRRAHARRGATRSPTRPARSSAPARSASLLLAIRAGGSEAGWAFQLQDPRTIMLLLLLAIAITANLLGLFELPVLGGSASAGRKLRHRRARRVRRDALRRAVPRRGARDGAAASAGRIGRWCSPRSGLASRCRSCWSRFVPALRTRLPKPGPWMGRLQRFLAIPMAASAVAALWLLYRQGGRRALLLGLAGRAGDSRLLLFGAGQRQRDGGAASSAALAGRARRGRPLFAASPARNASAAPVAGADAAWSEARSRRRSAAGQARCSSISPPTGA